MLRQAPEARCACTGSWRLISSDPVQYPCDNAMQGVSKGCSTLPCALVRQMQSEFVAVFMGVDRIEFESWVTLPRLYSRVPSGKVFKSCRWGVM